MREPARVFSPCHERPTYLDRRPRVELLEEFKGSLGADPACLSDGEILCQRFHDRYQHRIGHELECGCILGFLTNPPLSLNDLLQQRFHRIEDVAATTAQHQALALGHRAWTGQHGCLQKTPTAAYQPLVPRLDAGNGDRAVVDYE